MQDRDRAWAGTHRVQGRHKTSQCMESNCLSTPTNSDVEKVVMGVEKTTVDKRLGCRRAVDPVDAPGGWTHRRSRQLIQRIGFADSVGCERHRNLDPFAKPTYGLEHIVGNGSHESLTVNPRLPGGRLFHNPCRRDRAKPNRAGEAKAPHHCLAALHFLLEVRCLISFPRPETVFLNGPFPELINGQPVSVR